MKLLLYVFLLAMFIPALSFAQTIQTGYAVVTPLTGGTGSGLSVTEVFGELVGTSLFQSSVIGSPLVTLTDVIVSVNPDLGVDTGVAIVNPNNTPTTVTLTLGNAQGVTTDIRKITLGARQQISDFVTQLFLGSAAVASPMTGLLFISAEVPIGVLGLSFTGLSFTSLPVASQLTVANVVPVTTITTVTPGTPLIGTPATGQITVTNPTAAVANVIVFPPLAIGIGGPGSLLLPQVAAGAGWVSQITIANTSGTTQAVRVDFFDPFGAPLTLPSGSSVPSLVIPSGGVATITTAAP